ncbi:ABC transporter substrate-binding protein [Clostridium sp. AF18-27]|nr:ABC transporter substrate-binding protein [Clostridium sp. AF18-27]
MVNGDFMKKVVLAVLVVTLGAICIGCVADEKSSEKPNKISFQTNLTLEQLKASLMGDITVYALESDPGEKINPVTTRDTSADFLFEMMYQPLFSQKNGQFNMVLAEAIEKEDDFTYIVSLKPNIFWSDGTALTADDVVFTYQLMQEETSSWAYTHLNYPEGAVKVRKADEFTVLFSFPLCHADGAAMLADILILPEHIFKIYNERYTIDNSVFWRKPVGSGPFIVDEYAAGKYYLFKKNKYYPFFPEERVADFLIISNVKNTRESVSSFSENRADITTIPSWDIRILNKKIGRDSDESKVGMIINPKTRMRYLGINGKKVKNSRLREAIFYSMNRTLINESGFVDSKYYNSEYSFIPQSNLYYNSDTGSMYPWDLNRAKQLLEEVDLESLYLTLAYRPNDDAITAQAVIIKDLLSLADINIILKKVKSSSELYEYDMFLDDIPLNNEPDSYGKYFLQGSKLNMIHYYNPETDLLFKDGRSCDSDELRRVLYNEVQLQIMESAYFYPLCTYSSITLYRPGTQEMIYGY